MDVIYGSPLILRSALFSSTVDVCGCNQDSAPDEGDIKNDDEDSTDDTTEEKMAFPRTAEQG